MFMYNILRKGLIKPTPNNIIWCYTEWQPLYDAIRESMPQIQFVRGIPYNIQDDDFFNAQNNNVLILDDHMVEAKNDKRISQLFTRTSHHKNVINFLLLQNLFPRGKESRDIALNSHYVTLFNSPVDRQQVNLFARRIYPNNSDRFMSVYEAAVHRPYGNLTIDLRPTTSEKNRLQPNMLDKSARIQQKQYLLPTDNETIYQNNTLKDYSSPLESQIQSDTRPEDTVKSYSTINKEDYTDDDEVTSEDSFIMATACTDCGVLINNMDDLQHHIKTWCPRNNFVSFRKRARYEDDTDEDENYLAQKGQGSLTGKRDQDPSIEWQDVGLQRVWDRVSDKNLEYITVRRKKYQQQGKTQEWIEKKQRQFMEREFTKALVNAIEYSKYLMKAPLLRSILDSLNKTDPNTDQMVIKDKIKLLLKPIIKDIVSRVDVTEEEEEEESDIESDHVDVPETSDQD